MRTINRILLTLLYLSSIIAITALLYSGWNYYDFPQTDRPHHPLYESFKPGGIVGHGLGVIGSLLIIMLLGYPSRKHFKFMGNWGNIRSWLDFHIWMGLTGPMLILFHTTFKFGGIVAVSFWSMTAVVLSGIIGRYIYLQIPRSVKGNELSRKEIESEDRELMNELEAILSGNDKALRLISVADTGQTEHGEKGWINIFSWITTDIKLPFELSRLRKELVNSTNLTSDRIREIIKLVKSRTVLTRRIAFLETAQSLLHYWHIFHRPFAAVMFIIMFVHVGVVVLFGYRWIF